MLVTVNGHPRGAMKHIAAAVDLSPISSHLVVGPASRAQCIGIYLYILHKPATDPDRVQFDEERQSSLEQMWMIHAASAACKRTCSMVSGEGIG